MDDADLAVAEAQDFIDGRGIIDETYDRIQSLIDLISENILAEAVPELLYRLHQYVEEARSFDQGQDGPRDYLADEEFDYDAYHAPSELPDAWQ